MRRPIHYVRDSVDRAWVIYVASARLQGMFVTSQPPQRNSLFKNNLFMHLLPYLLKITPSANAAANPLQTRQCRSDGVNVFDVRQTPRDVRHLVVYATEQPLEFTHVMFYKLALGQLIWTINRVSCITKCRPTGLVLPLGAQLIHGICAAVQQNPSLCNGFPWKSVLMTCVCVSIRTCTIQSGGSHAYIKMKGFLISAQQEHL